MLSATLRAPALEFGNGAPTFGPKQQNGPPIRRRHLTQLGAKALVVRIPFTAALPGQFINNIIRSHALIGLELQIEFHSLLKALAIRVVAFPGA